MSKCPFCQHDETFQANFWTHCKNCGANAETAVWNNRTPSTEMAQLKGQLRDIKSILDLSVMERCVRYPQ